MTSLKVCIAYDTYSHEKSTEFLAAYCEQIGFSVCRIRLEGSYFNGVLPAALSNASLLILACGGRWINRILNRLPDGPERPVTVALFPGLVADHQIDAYITRLRCDHVLLNCEHDLALYRTICSTLRMHCNGLLYGTAWFQPAMSSYRTGGSLPVRKVLFVEQLAVPCTLHDRRALAQELANLARRNPAVRFLIKPRDAPASELGSYTEQTVSGLMFRQDMNLPANVELDVRPIADLLDEADAVFTVSSSVANEALLLRKHVYILGGFSGRQNYLSMFSGSGLMSSLKDLSLQQPPVLQAAWARSHLTDPRDTVALVVRRILETPSQDRRKIKGVSFFQRLRLLVLAPGWYASLKKDLRKVNSALRIAGLEK